ncbi:AAA domain-containing protein [Ureaplasma miroungigenitalium]|uniref:AAA domain-containing protein n=1 Tax=Ureaplasma miroungigenitalium TaxID=1042321 RepID=UPI0021E8234A|nr:AAA domain-containing protein [Ureaplasma miroungigenitalium]MCV3734049.1 AAA domain-containing protein [Ureaplasma miroungigenitalium]
MNNNQALQNKLFNLLSTDSRDQCIRTKIDKSHADLLTFFQLEDIKAFINNEISELEYKIFIDTQVLKKELSETFNVTEFNNVLKKYQLLLADVATKAKINALYDDFDEQQASMIEYIIKKVDGLISKLDAINHQAQIIYKQTGIWPLYIAYDYIIGNTIKPNAINAPINLLPVNLVKRANKLFLEHKKDMYTVNQKLLLFLKKDYNNSFVDFKEQANMLDDVKKLTNQNYITSYNSQNRFLNLSSTEIKEKFEQYFIYNAYVIGVFQPHGNAIKKDLEKLINDQVDVFAENYDDCQEVIADDYHLIRAQDPKPLAQLKKPLNLYQSYAIYSALVKNTLIYGPPGTGKSQVISNIIANVVLQQNNVLVVSEKKAALDVLIDRLYKLNNFTLYIDTDENKLFFYRKINDLLSSFGRFWLINDASTNKNNTPQIYSSMEARKIIKTNLLMQNLNRLVKNLYTNGFDRFKTKWLNLNTIEQELIKNEQVYVVLKQYVESKIAFESYFDSYIILNEWKQRRQLESGWCSLSELINKQKRWITLTKQHPEWLKRAQQQDASYQYERMQSFINDETNQAYFQNMTNYTLFEEYLRVFKQLIDLLQPADIAALLKQLAFYQEHFVALKPHIEKQKNKQNQLKILDYFLVNKSIGPKNFLFYRTTNHPDALQTTWETFNLINENQWLITHDEAILTIFYELSLADNITSYDLWLWQVYLDIQTPILDELNHVPLENLQEPVFDFLKQINFDAQKCTQLYELQQFYFEQLNDYAGLLTLRINDWFGQYKKDLNEFCAHLDQQIHGAYWDYLNNWIKQLPNESKEQLKNMLSVAKLSRQPDIATFIKEYYPFLIKLFPVWIAKPNDVCDIFPLQKDLFDYGIFDEASQMFLENAYPVLHRTKIKIVAGDDKQLKPTNFFSSRNEDNADYAIDDVDVAESLLDRTKSALWTTYWLKNHYRSQSADLIAFSAHHLYEDELVFASYNHELYAGVEVINTLDGVYRENTNVIEAQKIIELLIAHHEQYLSILVITFNLKQSELIENLIATNYFSHDIYQKLLDDEIQVVNLENVQGNEADLVILGVTYAKDEGGALRNQFGPIIKANGMNRLNVAITRARVKMLVVKSFMASELTLNKSNENFMVFYHFLHFCDEQNERANSWTEIQVQPEYTFDNLFDQQMFTFLKTLISEDQIIMYQYEILGSHISFAIYNQTTRQFDLMVDYAMTNTLIEKENFETLYDKYQFLVDRKYNILAFSIFELIADLEGVYVQIKQKYDSLTTDI